VQLYAKRKQEFDAGYFDLHERRWPVDGRTVDLSSHLLNMARETKNEKRNTIGEELNFQMELYERRFELMRRTLPTITSYSIHVSQNMYIYQFWVVFWWAIVFIPLTLLSCVTLSCVGLYIRRAHA